MINNREYEEILSIETTESGPNSLEWLLEEHGKIYLYDYIEVQCQPTTSLYGVVRYLIYGDELFTVMDRINSKYDVNYSVYREFNDGTIIWELTQK